MSNVIPFNFNSNKIRVIMGDDGEPWFVASDVLGTLGLDRKALERLDDDEKGVSSIHTLGGHQEMTTVNEPGMFSLVLGSRKPAAKEFKRWVTHEVLPSIRKTGAYRVRQEEPQHSVPELIDANTLFRSNYDTAQILFKGNQAILSANKATRKATGVDVLENLDATHLIADQKEVLLTASDIGKQIGLSAIRVNLLLEERGLLRSFRDGKERKQHELTADGEAMAEYLDTGKKHGDGTPIRQIKWHGKVVSLLGAGAPA